MIKQIIDEIKESLEIDIIWADVFAGLAKTAVRNINSEGGLISKKFPVYENTNKTTCQGNDYISLIPDNTKMGIIYFTDLGTAQVDCNSRYTDYESVIRCIAWVNLKKINQTYTNTDILLNDLMSSIPSVVLVQGVCKINITLRNPVIKSVNIFSEYSYSEEINQYIVYPYDYFAFDFLVQWSLPRHCVTPTLDPSTCK
jgi:hypothetical protein